MILTLPYEVIGSEFLIEANKAEWLGRLFYKNEKSLVTDKDFFVTKNGHQDPLSELKESVRLILHHDLKFPCQFPGRYKYLVKRFKIGSKKNSCPDYQFWEDSFEISGMSLMFVSQYLQNPASSFGHTYLKINSRNKNLFLNKVISFSALIPGNTNSLDYILKGITGGFDGTFSESPFYILYHEYSNMEKRDVWEYELNLSKEESLDILSTLFELIYRAKFDYKFLSNNCSSILLKLIEASTHKDLSSHLPYYVIPIETVKVLKNQKMIVNSFYHPSITSRLVRGGKKLSSKEKKEVKHYLNSSKKLSLNSSAETIDVVLEYLNFKRQKNLGTLNDKDKKDFDRYIIQRAGTRERPSERGQGPELPLDPIKSSHPRRLSFGVLNDHQLALSFRPVGKDFLDRPHGYIRESEINIFKSRLIFSSQGSVKPQVDLLGLRKYSDFNFLTKDLSWGGNVSYNHSSKILCSGCYYTEFDSHLGVGKSFFKDYFLYYLVFHPTFRLRNLSHAFNFVPQLETGIIYGSDYVVWRSFIFSGFIFDGIKKRYFHDFNNSFSYVINETLSVYSLHKLYHQAGFWNSLEFGLSYYF